MNKKIAPAAPGSKPLLSLIIAVYNKPDFLEKIFLSLESQTFTDFEIVVADDGSGPRIAELVGRYSSQMRRPAVHVWHEDQGFRKTIIANKAVAAAHADYLVFIDGDCILHRKFLESHFRHRARSVALAGRRVTLDRDITESLSNDDVASGRMEKPWFWWNHCEKAERKHGLYLPILQPFSNLKKKGYSMYGSNFSLFKEDYYSVNGYDEGIIGRGVEDDNLRARLKLSGAVVRSITRIALQYHLFHKADPVPHSRELILEYCFPKQAWAEKGLVKKGAGR
jgi:glycosyltransferase involved in cell wall biosynthesis